MRVGDIWRFSLGKLVGWWQLDGNIKDSSGNNHHGIVRGNPTWVPGRVDRALKFDGIDDYVDIDSINLPVWTVVLWVKSSNAPSSGPQCGPLHFGTNFHINWDDYDSDFRGAACLQVMGKWYDATFGRLEANIWYHLSATYDGKRFKTYKNSDLITDNPYPSGIQEMNGSHLLFGRLPSSDYYFSGIVDDIRVYNYALTHEELIELFEKDKQ